MTKPFRSTEPCDTSRNKSAPDREKLASNSLSQRLRSQKRGVINCPASPLSHRESAVVNTMRGDREALEDGFEIRRAAAERRIPCFTSLDTARAAVESLLNGADAYNVKPLSAYLAGR